MNTRKPPYDPDGEVQSITRTDVSPNVLIASYTYGTSGLSHGAVTSVTDNISGIQNAITYQTSGGGIGQPANVQEYNPDGSLKAAMECFNAAMALDDAAADMFLNGYMTLLSGGGGLASMAGGAGLGVISMALMVAGLLSLCTAGIALEMCLDRNEGAG